jgi:hypothetical protein
MRWRAKKVGFTAPAVGTLAWGPGEQAQGRGEFLGKHRLVERGALAV